LNIFARYLNNYTISMKARLERQIAIRKLVSQNRITNQEDLLAMLQKEGFHLTQATLSRDMKNLQIAKTPGQDGKYSYVLSRSLGNTPANERVDAENFLADGFLNIEFSGNMAVIRTKPAYASSIASIIDRVNSFEILGTIAGDDTIFLVLREGVEASDVVVLLENTMPNLKEKLI